MIGRRMLALTLDTAGLLATGGAPTASGGTRQRRLFLPDIPVVTSDRRQLRLRSDVLGDSVVAMDVIWGGCTTVCPISSRIMRAVQDLVRRPIRPRVRLLSLTVDPAATRRSVLQAYAAAVSLALEPV